MEVVKFNIMDGFTYNKIIDTMKEMVHREKCESFSSFNNNEQCWKIGFEVLRRLRGINPNFRNSSEIGEILDIKVGRILYHPDDTSKICLIRDCVRRNLSYGLPHYNLLTEITNVIFNDPATIVFWDDGTKTVVKAENEPFDPEKGLAMAIAKKSLGNKGNYYNEFKKWLPEEEAKWKNPAEKVCSSCKYFTLDSSALAICQECLKDETLPNWEKADRKDV